MPRAALVALSLALVAACDGFPGRSAPELPAELARLERAAAAGDRAAQHDLAVAFRRGEAVPRDYARAAALWRPLADAGHPEASNSLAYLTYHGHGVDRDLAAAVRIWRRAVELGVAESNLHLGRASLAGEGVPRDPVEAYARFRAAELMVGETPDSVDAEVAATAVAQMRELDEVLSPREHRHGEVRARAYAAVPVPAPAPTSAAP